MAMGWIKNYIRNDFKNPQEKKRKFAKIRALFDLSEKNKYSIDDQTWNDLVMDEVYSEIDRTYSSAGEAALYSILRNPIMDEERLKKRRDLISKFKEDLDLTTKIRIILYDMGFDRKNILLEMIDQNMVVNKMKYYIYTILGKVIPAILILCVIILKEPRLMTVLLVSIFINFYISQKEETVVRAKGLVYLKSLFVAAKKISKIENEEIKYYTTIINSNLKDLKKVDKGLIAIKFIKAFGDLFDLVAMPLLLHETTYYKISAELEGNEGKIFSLMYMVGEIDAFIGIASYISSNEDKISSPKFIEETSLFIKEGIHPLLKNPVANTIDIDKKGIVLTGTNMSGKSTFLRMIGTNILLAQTFYFVFAKEYRASFFNIVTSISPKDDIVSGKSYYLAEAESLLRIINNLDNDVPVFCAIDEIFRGTNPVERIASSAEILRYINERDSISIVATHDMELTEMLRENYDFYYFSERVDDKSGLKFDYKIKRGVSETRNAIKLLDYIGYPKEITTSALRRCKEISHYR